MKYLVLAYGDQRKMEALTKGEFEDLVARCKGHDEERCAGPAMWS